MELCKAAFLFCGGAKLNKSIQSNIIEMLFLLMVIPRKVNFTQMGRYCKRGEPTQMEIAKACGLEKAGLVYYFPFKQNLFVVIVDKYVFHPQQLEKSSNLQQVRSRSLSTSITAV